MATYSSITIIYNPKSTGPGKPMATDLYKQLTEALPKIAVSLVPTKYAGHAKKIAYDTAMKYTSPLIVSVSGDGGYNEVVNGAMKAYAKGRKPITSLLPAGNANDHHSSLSGDDLLRAITKHDVQKIDVLLLTATAGKEVVRRWAHSYIGFGMTSDIGKVLTASKLNWITEKLIVLKGLIKPKATSLVIQGRKQSIDSLTISNIDRMAKVLKFSKNSGVTDGLFEVSIAKHKHRFSLFTYISKASTVGIDDSIQTDSFELDTPKKTLVQADGEVFSVPAKSHVHITIKKSVLHYIV